MIAPDTVFLLLAGIASLGFVLDALFSRLRIASVLPLMLLGLLMLVTGVIPRGTISVLNSFIPYVSAITVAFILFAVGLEIRYSDLFKVLARATAFTLLVQVATGVAISIVAFYFLRWGLLVSFIFGFALSGPSSIAVPVLLRVARPPAALRASLLFESVITDVLQLLVPLVMIGFLVSGSQSLATISSTLAWTVLGSVAGGIAAGLVWIWLLARLQAFVEGYTWTLTITMVLATYGAADRLGLSPAISIFVFGLALGNASLFHADPGDAPAAYASGLRGLVLALRARLGLSTRGLDVPHILQVQKEVSFFASSFFFVYIGLLFQLGGLDGTLVAVAAMATMIMLGVRFLGAPLLAPYLDPEPVARRSQRGLVVCNVSRGLASAVVATVPQGLGIVIPGFLDAIFLGILFSTVVSTVGIFILYRPGSPPVASDSVRPDPVVPERVVRAPTPDSPPAVPSGRPEPEPAPPPPLPQPRRPPPPAGRASDRPYASPGGESSDAAALSRAEVVPGVA